MVCSILIIIWRMNLYIYLVSKSEKLIRISVELPKNSRGTLNSIFHLNQRMLD